MTKCHVCNIRVRPCNVVWRDVLVSRQTHSSPAEYEEVPMHSHCADGVFGDEPDEAYERAASRYDGLGKDWR